MSSGVLSPCWRTWYTRKEILSIRHQISVKNSSESCRFCVSSRYYVLGNLDTNGIEGGRGWPLRECAGRKTEDGRAPVRLVVAHARQQGEPGEGRVRPTRPGTRRNTGQRGRGGST